MRDVSSKTLRLTKLCLICVAVCGPIQAWKLVVGLNFATKKLNLYIDWELGKFKKIIFKV